MKNEEKEAKTESRKRKYIQFEDIPPDEPFPEAFNLSKQKRDFKGWKDSMEWILSYFEGEWNSDLEEWCNSVTHCGPHPDDWYKHRIQSFADHALTRWPPYRPTVVDANGVTKLVTEQLQGISVLGAIVAEYAMNHPIKPILVVLDFMFDYLINTEHVQSAYNLSEAAMTKLLLDLGRDTSKVCSNYDNYDTEDENWAALYLFIDDVDTQIKIIERMFSLRVPELEVGEVATVPHPNPLFMEYRDVYCYVLRAEVARE